MRIIQCDHCTKTVRPNEFGLPPTGWIQVVRTTSTVAPPLEFCSTQCTIDRLTDDLAHAAIPDGRKDPHA